MALDQEIGSSVNVEIESVGLAIKIECAGCGLHARLSASGLRLPPYTPLLDLEAKLRCRECDPKGKAVGSRWGARPPS